MAILFKGKAPAGAARSGNSLQRWFFHTAVFVTAATAGGALMVWPQWVAADGARVGLEIQGERETELAQRLDVVRGMVNQQRAWQKQGRRVLLASEVRGYPLIAHAIAKREGVGVAKVQMLDGRTQRWRTVTLDGAAGESGLPQTAGEIRPLSVRMVFKGSFDGVYRTVAALSEQQQLFIPETWEISAGHGADAGKLWADISGTVFVVHQPDEEEMGPVVPEPAGPVARGVSWEGKG